MGILRNKEGHGELIRVEEIDTDDALNLHINYDDYVFDESDSEEQTINNFPLGIRQKKKWKKPVTENMTNFDGISIKKNMGARKWCRVENAKLVYSFANLQDVIFDGSDIVTQTFSSFSRVLQDEENLKAWHEFIGKNEEEQRRILDEIETQLRRVNIAQEDPVEQADENCPEYRFSQIEKRVRNSLAKRKYVKYDLLDNIETELREFFAINPMGNYEGKLNAYQKRFYLIAVAQYLLLKVCDKVKAESDCTDVVSIQNANNGNGFYCPSCRLSTYLKQRRMKTKIC